VSVTQEDALCEKVGACGKRQLGVGQSHAGLVGVVTKLTTTWCNWWGSARGRKVVVQSAGISTSSTCKYR